MTKTNEVNVNLEGFPLLNESEFHEEFNPGSHFADYFLTRPVFEYLPDFSELDEEERANYLYKDLKGNGYLTGMEVISDKWINLGFCGYLLETFGLVLCEANPVKRKGGSSGTEEMIYLRFKHISQSAFGVKKTIVNT